MYPCVGSTPDGDVAAVRGRTRSALLGLGGTLGEPDARREACTCLLFLHAAPRSTDIILRTAEQQARSPLTRWPIALDVFRTLIEHESVGRSQVEANVL